MQHDVYFVAKLFVSVAKGGRDNNRNVQGVIQWHVFFLCAFLYLSYVKLYKVEVRTSFKPNTFGHLWPQCFYICSNISVLVKTVYFSSFFLKEAKRNFIVTKEMRFSIIFL